MKTGTQVRFTVNNLGCLDRLSDTKFAKAIVNEGDRGEYWKPYNIPEADWHLVMAVVDGQEYVVPVHASQFEAMGPPVDGLKNLLRF